MCGAVGDVEEYIRLCFSMSHKYFKDAKAMQINRIWNWVKFDLSSPITLATIGILTKVFYTSGPNLVILAWTGDKLWHGQASDWRTHRRTDAGNDNTQRPKLASGKNWKSMAVVKQE